MQGKLNKQMGTSCTNNKIPNFFIADDVSFSKLQPHHVLSEERTSGFDPDLHFEPPPKQDPGG